MGSDHGCRTYDLPASEIQLIFGRICSPIISIARLVSYVVCGSGIERFICNSYDDFVTITDAGNTRCRSSQLNRLASTLKVGIFNRR